ncbi:O-antigen ligase family protein [Psychrosphaera sp. 1_MG-2023]|uniref:O-antigen ligase family protein n=1 Tax=Psychrosphaera sp. 1_MG-2023 TaxID=3062643 RepID=UPI0026E20205|nr:O-antigen ligase family protein [Psychrosphaera sp. 1_MG-2023]MDO6720370.1 O-antigen ligase family protein [Psychrosphaera sp. 1_MG-2023]
MSLTAIVYLLVYFGCLLKAFTTKPIWGLYAYLIAFYAHPIARWWGYSLPELRWSFMAALITLIALFLNKSKNEKGSGWFEFKETKLFVIFFIFLLMQYGWALNSSLHTVYVLLAFKYLILIALIQGCIKTKSDVIGFIAANVCGALYFAYLGASYQNGRLEGIGGPGIESSNGLGQHLSILLIFSSYLLFVKLGKAKYLLVIAIIFILNTIMLTGSRGAILAILLTGVLSLFFIPKGYKKHFIGLATLGAIAFSLLIGPQILERFQGMKSDTEGQIKDKSAASRLVIIESQLQMFLERPIIGQGHRTTLLLSPIYIPQEYMATVRTAGTKIQRRASHNFIMGMLTDHGVIGLGLFSLIALSISKHLFRVRKLDPLEVDNELLIIQTGLCLGFFCYLVAGLFSNNKIFEISIWLIAIIPVVNKMLVNSKAESSHVN